jgi:hypothetical protein
MTGLGAWGRFRFKKGRKSLLFVNKKKQKNFTPRNNASGNDNASSLRAQRSNPAKPQANAPTNFPSYAAKSAASKQKIF